MDRRRNNKERGRNHFLDIFHYGIRKHRNAAEVDAAKLTNGLCRFVHDPISGGSSVRPGHLQDLRF